MKNVLVIFNSTHIPNYLMASAVNIGKTNHFFLHALFLITKHPASEYSYVFPNDLTLTENRLTGKSLEEEDRELTNSYIALFRDECNVAGVPNSTAVKGNFSFQDLVQYSAFFDLILADARSDFYEFSLHDLLADVHCPVLLTQTEIERVDLVTFTYDGSPSSIYAIKMFTYLFPEWNTKPVNLVHITSKEGNLLPQDDLARAWLSLHYQQVHVHIIQGKEPALLISYIESMPEHHFLVMGAMGRNAVSKLFHKSYSTAVMHKTQASVFITHQ